MTSCNMGEDSNGVFKYPFRTFLNLDF